MEIIKTENIGKVYDNNGVPVNALKGIDLTINRGEYIVIAGPSGSGKTTLLNLLGTLDKPTNGKIYFENEDVSKKSRRELSEFRLRKFGFIFQAYNLIPVLTAYENIEFSMILLGIEKKERRKRVMSLMEELGIKEMADKKPNDMSGGQQQRVAAARAIINNPSIVLADEPTANLDSNTGANLMDMLKKLNREKEITFIFSSHDNLVIERAERLLILKDGMLEK